MLGPQNMITKRIGQETERFGIMTPVLSQDHKQGLTRDEIDSTIAVLVLAGSGETTAVAIAATTYFALKNPTIMKKVAGEVRAGLVDDPEDCTNAAISKLSFLHATIQEAMRMHPPVPLSPPRLIDRPGAQICGVPIRQDTVRASRRRQDSCSHPSERPRTPSSRTLAPGRAVAVCG